MKFYTRININSLLYSNNIINNINTVTIQIYNNSTVNDMLLHELVLLCHHT